MLPDTPKYFQILRNIPRYSERLPDTKKPKSQPNKRTSHNKQPSKETSKRARCGAFWARSGAFWRVLGVFCIILGLKQKSRARNTKMARATLKSCVRARCPTPRACAGLASRPVSGPTARENRFFASVRNRALRKTRFSESKVSFQE